jgi:hypothetical protein
MRALCLVAMSLLAFSLSAQVTPTVPLGTVVDAPFVDLRWQTRSENQHADDLTNEVFKDFCDMMSVRYGFVVGTRTGQGDDFIADPDQINRLLDQMDACPSPADAVF